MFQKISKNKAHRFYAERKDFVMVPCNLRPDSFAAVKVDAWNFDRMIEAPFDMMVNYFEYYNCTCRETGRKAAFYVKVA